MKILIVFLLASLTAFPCSTLQLRGAEHVYYGKNYDWDETHGALIFNTRGLKKTAVATKNPEVWTSKFASLTFNQPGLDFPQGGMNEKGVVIEVMIGPMDTPKNSSLKRINELQWVQRILDLSGSTEEALTVASQVVIEKIQVDLHYLICDKERNCATVEHMDGKPAIHKNVQYPVLTNADYDSMLSYLGEYEGFGGKKKIPQGSTSHARFARVADHLRKYSLEEPFSYIFDTLDNVAISKSWQIVYDQTARKIQFRVNGINEIHEVAFPENISYSCASGLQAIDLESDTTEVSFAPYTKQWNDSLVDKTSHASSQIKKMLKNYPVSVECTEVSNLGSF